jgi:hypothetical protein
MTAPWIEIAANQDPDVPAGPGYSDHTWQALFACQVMVLPYKEWFKLKWGFNAAALFDETLERQKLFLESQYLIRSDVGFEPPEYRTLAYRFVSRPGDALLVVVLGKIKGCNQKDAQERATVFYNEIKSIFPYDYTLVPACTRQEFLNLSGYEILDEESQRSHVVQIKRAEVSLTPERNSPLIQGMWHSEPRAHEQIWRSMAGAACPVLLNITLRSTLLYEKEQGRLLQSTHEISEMAQKRISQGTLAEMKQRYQAYVERYVSPWKKFYYLQIHLASSQATSESLSRIIGTSLTVNRKGNTFPGYQVSIPASEDVPTWQKKIRNLDLHFSGSYLPVPRLSEVADLEEVFAAVRLPYSPPEDGFPDVSFGRAGNE